MSNVTLALLKNPNGQRFVSININDFFAMLACSPFKYCQNETTDDLTIMTIAPAARNVLRKIGIRTPYFAYREGNKYFVHETMVAIFSGQVKITQNRCTII